MFNTLFDTYKKDLEENNVTSEIYVSYLNYMSEEYKKNTNARIIIDFIAGMTDDFFIKEYKIVIDRLED